VARWRASGLSYGLAGYISDTVNGLFWHPCAICRRGSRRNILRWGSLSRSRQDVINADCQWMKGRLCSGARRRKGSRSSSRRVG